MLGKVKKEIDDKKSDKKVYTTQEAKALSPNKERIARVERLGKLKAVYDNAAVQYNTAQTKAAEANKVIDKYKVQISEMEQQIKGTEDELNRINERVALVNQNENDTLLKEQNLLKRKIKKDSKRLKSIRSRLAKAVEDAQEKGERLEKALNKFKDAELMFSPYAEILEKEEKKISSEKAAIAKAINDAKEREQEKKFQKKLAKRRKLIHNRRAKKREKATKELGRELNLMKQERVKKARKEGRELSPAELEQWATKEKDLRERLEKYYNENQLIEESIISNPESFKDSTSRLTEAKMEFYRIQNEVSQTERELDNLRNLSRDFEKKIRESERTYYQKTQDLLNAKGTNRAEIALKAAQEVEKEYRELTTALRKYREQETNAVKRALNIKKDLVDARDRLDLAKENYEKYQLIAERQRKKDLEDKKIVEGLTKKTRYPGTAGPDGVSYQGSWPLDHTKKAITIRAENPAGKMYTINMISIIGDQQVVYNLKNWPDYEGDARYSPMSDADVEAFRNRLVKDLQDEGYVFATVSVYKQELTQGMLKFRVHAGVEGDLTVVGNRWYTAKQILDDLSWETGKGFNYRQFYFDLYNLNSRPDLRINSKLIPKIDDEDRRTIDVEMNVIDRFPLHGALKLGNTGVKETSDWRWRSTVQHLNFSHRDDILTFEWLTDPKDVQDVNAVSASYYLPFFNDNGLSLYSGWSESSITDVAPDIDVFGEGFYFGTQFSRVIKSSDKFSISTTVGWLFQNVENFNEFAGEQTGPESDINLSMPSLTIGFSGKEFDKFEGRNFISNTLQANVAGKLGSSDKDEFGTNVEGNFIINRFHFTRFQKLFSGPDGLSKWTLFFQFNAQVTDDALTPAVQKSFGGVNSIRGYEEREVSADNGFTGSIEFQSPLISNFIPTLQRSKEYLSNNPDDWTVHRLQFVGFYDFGRSEKIDPLRGEEKNVSFSSLGAGIRLALTKFSQFRFDFGIPLISTNESSGGRSHVSLQVQF